MLTWFTELGAAERRTFWAAFGGFAFDGMDILLYTFVIPTLIVQWSMSRADAGTIATVALLTSALGGWAGGVLADRVGRVRTLQLTILWYSVFTALSGLTNSFGQLLAVRALQGLGFGAEWAVGAMLVGEIVRPEHRGKAVGCVQSAWAVGWGMAAIGYAATYALLPEAVAWRVLFAAGFLPSLLVIYVRRRVRDSAAFAHLRDGAPLAQVSRRGSFAAIFGRDLIGPTLLGALLATGVQGGYYAVMTWLPTYLRTVRHLSVVTSSGYLAVVIVAAWVGYIAGAYLSDALGRRRSFLVFSACSIAAVVAYTTLPISDAAMLLLGFPLGFFASGIYSGLGAWLAELYPTRVRGSGMGFTYNFGRAIGATFPTLVGFLSSRISLGGAIGVFAAVAYALVVLSVLALPETRGRPLLE